MSRVRHLSISVLALTALTASAGAVGTRHFVLERGKDFEEGKLEGAAVDSSGVVRAGLSVGNVESPDASSAFAAAWHEGRLYVATGTDGRLLEVTGAAASPKVRVAAQAKVLALSSLAVFDGKLVAGAMPGGVLLALDGDHFVEFAKLDGADNVFALAVSGDGSALYVATGPNGKLFRVTKDGTAQAYFDSDEAHLVSVAAKGSRVLTGSSGKALLYEITGPGRATVLHDFDRTEVRAIAIADDGAILAAANELKHKARGEANKSSNSAGPDHQSPQGGKGELVRIAADGVPEKLFDDDKDFIASLALDGNGRPLVGTGAEGRVYRIGDHHRTTLLVDLDERQVAAIAARGQKGDTLEGYVVSSDPLVVHPILGEGGSGALWTSAVLDAGLRAHFGLLRFDGRGVKLSTRSGQTSEPDSTWSDWSPEFAADTKVLSPPGRYFQVRARVENKDGELRRVEVPFVTDNARAVLTAIEAESPAVSKGKTGLVKSGQPLEGDATSNIEVTFKVDNPDQDELRFRVDYQRLGDREWLDALEPGVVLTKDRFTWKTRDLAEGRYRLRVTVSDELSNPRGRALVHELESQVVLVDNTAPRFAALSVRGTKVEGAAIDGASPIRRLEYRRAGADEWLPIESKDGIFDEAREEFSLDFAKEVTEAPLLVTLRAYDTAGNFQVEHLRIER